MDLRGQQDAAYPDTGPLVMDYVEEDRGRPKRCKSSFWLFCLFFHGDVVQRASTGFRSKY